jgi:hypothetical protein
VRTTARTVVEALARCSLLALGVGLATLSFVNLVEVHDQIVLASPWWWLGLIGIVATALGLGAPWPPRRHDAGS